MDTLSLHSMQYIQIDLLFLPLPHFHHYHQLDLNQNLMHRNMIHQKYLLQKTNHLNLIHHPVFLFLFLFLFLFPLFSVMTQTHVFFVPQKRRLTHTLLRLSLLLFANSFSASSRPSLLHFCFLFDSFV